MRIRHKTYSPDAVDRNGISLAQTTAGAASLTITGALASGGVATLDIPRTVSFYSGGDISGVTFTLTGTDRMGDALTETVTGPNTTTVYSEYYYKTVTAIAASAAVGTNVEVGSGNGFASGWYPVDTHIDRITNRIYLSDTPSMTWELFYTYDNPFSLTFDEYDCDSISAGAATTLSNTIVLNGGVRALRLVVTSFSTGDIKWTIALDE